MSKTFALGESGEEEYYLPIISPGFGHLDARDLTQNVNNPVISTDLIVLSRTCMKRNAIK
jgi:hypothetical protein